MRWACVLGLLLALLNLSTSLLLGAWNIQIFGITKASNKDLMNYISEIVCRYDIILIQEVRVKDLKVPESAIKKLMAAVNNRCPLYDYIASEPLGATIQHQERYVFLYRVPMVSKVKSYTYDDPHYGFYDIFSRPPFIVEFSSEYTVVENFVLIPQHTTPEKAVEQIDALYDVVEDVETRWKTKNIVLLGDFNAGGTYVSRLSDWQKIRLFTEPGFHWLITNDQNTAVSGGPNPKAYDRIVVTNDMNKGVKLGSAEVYDFMSAFGLTRKKGSLISDHFPVEVTLL